MNNLQLESYLNHLLSVDLFQDYAPNGLQIEGTSKIKTIATAVTASLNVIERAVAFGADALLVHHGYFWKGESPVLKGIKYKRISTIIHSNLNLFAYHLPLDVYQPWGNNAFFSHQLGIHIDLQKKNNLLCFGKLKDSLTAEDFMSLLNQKFNTSTIMIGDNNKTIKSISWCTGSAQDFFEDALSEPIDAYITGEFSERTYHLAKESNVAFFALGHHASERGGILSLGEHLASEFGFKHLFIDEENPF